MKHNYTGPLIVLGTLAAVGVTAAIAKGGAKPLTTTKGAPLPGSSTNPLPVPSSEAPAKRVPVVGERLKRLWPEATGESGPMPPAALELALAQAWLESGVADPAAGSWWKDKTAEGKGDMRASGNLGAHQCTKNDAGGPGYTCVEYGDTRPNADGTSTPYSVKFRFFRDADGKPAGDWAALDYLRSIVKDRPKSFAAMKTGDVRGFAQALHDEHYYEGFGATVPERIDGYAKALASHLPAVAAALGHQQIAAVIVPELVKGKVAGAELGGAANDNAGALQALYLSGALPRARMRPESGELVWYLEAGKPNVAGPFDDIFPTVTKALEKVPMFGPAAAAAATGIKSLEDHASGHDPRTSAEKEAGKAKEAAELAAKHAAEACAPERTRADAFEAAIREWTTRHPHLASWTKPDLLAAIAHHEGAAAAHAPKAYGSRRTHAPPTAGVLEAELARLQAAEDRELGGIIGGALLVLATAIATALGVTAVVARGLATRLVTRLEATGIHAAAPGAELPADAQALPAADVVRALAEPLPELLQREGWRFYRLASAPSRGAAA